MARPGLHQHRKFLRLVRVLGVPPYAARGILEMLWEPAYDSGDDLLGDAEDIAARCGWAGASVILADALLDCGFIDPDEQRGTDSDGLPVMYRIHDLFDHAPTAMHRRVKRETERQDRSASTSQLLSAAGKKRAASAKRAKGRFSKVLNSHQPTSLSPASDQPLAGTRDSDHGTRVSDRCSAGLAPAPAAADLDRQQHTLPLLAVVQPEPLATPDLASLWAAMQERRIARPGVGCEELSPRVRELARTALAPILAHLGASKTLDAWDNYLHSDYPAERDPPYPFDSFHRNADKYLRGPVKAKGGKRDLNAEQREAQAISLTRPSGRLDPEVVFGSVLG